MQKHVILVIILLSLCPLFSLDHVPGQFLVQFQDNDPQAVQKLCDQFSNNNLKSEQLLSRRLNIWLCSFNPDKINEDKFLVILKNDPGIKFVQYNHYVKERETYPDDPDFSNQWHHENTGQMGGTIDADIDAVEAWDINTGGVTALGDTIVLAIIDSGNYLGHDDLYFWKNEAEIPDNDIDDDGNGYIDDYDGWNSVTHNGNISNSSHGTHVSGIAGAIGNNGTGVCGVNWGAKIMPIRGSSPVESIVVEAYGYVLEMRTLYNETNGDEGAFVVATNASFGVNFGNPDNYPIWCAIYDSLGTQGILNVGATMNNNSNVDETGDMPTACDSDFLISVTNTNNNDMKNSNAAYGLISIDLGAPGTDIYSTDQYNQYSYKTGTSMAAPQVTGAIGYIISAAPAEMMIQYQENPAEVALEIREILLNGVDPIDNLEGITVTGGRLNIYNSIQLFEEIDDFTVSGLISEDTVWDTELVKVIGDVTVLDSVTLTITSGATVEFQGYYSLTVEGNIIASGEDHEMIYFTINDFSDFSNPESTDGGWKGIEFIGTPSDSSLILNCNISYTKSDAENPNVSTSAIKINERDNVRIDLCNFTHHMHESGSAIACYNEANPIIKTSHFEECNAFVKGGAIYLDYSSPSIKDNSFTDNTANEGGVISINHASPSIVNNSFTDNTAFNGSAISCVNSDPDIIDNYFHSNICLPGQSTKGGAIYLDNSSPLISNNNFSNNRALQGGAIFGMQCGSDIINNYFESNTNPYGQISAGGAIYLWCSNCLIRDNSFQNNVSGRHGGGVHLERINESIEPNYIINNTFSYNDGGDVGGAICCYVDSKAIIFGNLINNNSAEKGGGIYSNSAYLKELSNNTFYMNEATNSSSALLLSQQYNMSKFQNNIFWNNTATDTISPITLNECVVEFEYNLLENGIESITQLNDVDLSYENNLSENPQFSDIPEEFLMLTHNSPAINTGLADMTELFITTLDLAGNPRIYDGYNPVIDMGAYEYQSDIVNSEEEELEIPRVTSICSIYPNPFASALDNRSSGINFTLFCAEEGRNMILEIYNIKGQKIKELSINNPRKGNFYNLNWNGLNSLGKEISSGIYFSRLTSNNNSDFRKFLKIK